MPKIKPRNILGKIFENVKKKKWSCLHLDCNEMAINSHLGQQNGILSELENNGHLIQVKPNSAHEWNKKVPIEFKKLGISQSVSLPIFCNLHDTKVFKYIESNNSELEAYTSFLLFSYRTLCAEIRKKEIAIEHNRRVCEANSLEGKINKDVLEKYRLGLEFGIRDLNILKKELNDELETPTEKYKYWIIELPRYEVFATTLISVWQVGTRDANEFNLENLYIHFIPRPNKSILLIGYNKNYFTEEMIKYCESWINLTKQETDIKLTNLLTNQVENWVMSPNMFSKLSFTKRKKYINLLIRDINHCGIPKSKEFNLFDDL